MPWPADVCKDTHTQHTHKYNAFGQNTAGSNYNFVVLASIINHTPAIGGPTLIEKRFAASSMGNTCGVETHCWG